MPNKSKIEPGLLPIFRLFVAIEWPLLGLSLFSLISKRVTVPDYFSIIVWLQTSFLLIYLWWQWLPKILGDFYLPIALLTASLGPIFGQVLAIVLRMKQGLVGEAAQVDAGGLYIWLLLPLLLISSQYGLRTLFSFTIGTSLLPVIMAYLLTIAGGPSLNPTVEHAFSRLFLFSLAGFVVVRLSKAQRKQREELAQKNVQLMNYATTLEQLAVSRERNRMARELHDTLAHTLSAVNVQLKALEVLLETNPAVAQQALKQTQDLTRNGLHEARRALHDLRANPVEELGLLLALQRLATLVAERAGLKLHLQLPPRFTSSTPEIEQTIYRIAEEALNNVVRHAQAANLTICLQPEISYIRLTISDDGLGFDLAQSVPGNHYGLIGMKERAALLDGKLEIFSQPQGGTKVQLGIKL